MASVQRNPAQTLPPAQAAPGGHDTPRADVQWTCKTQFIADNGQVGGDLPAETSIGTRFLLSCEGPALELDGSKLSLELPKEQKYQLKILETKKINASGADFIATSWAVGENKLTNPLLTDGVHRVALGEIKFTIASVIDQKKNPEHKPFGPWSAVALPLPLWIWLGVVLLFAALALPLWVFIRRRLRRRRLRQLLDQNAIALTAYQHFNKELRRLVRSIPHRRGDWTNERAADYARELDEQLRWFLARELFLPVFGRGPGEILRDLRKQHPALHSDLRRDFAVALGEIHKARQSQSPIAIEDAQQITELARRLADQIAQSRGKNQ